MNVDVVDVSSDDVATTSPEMKRGGRRLSFSFFLFFFVLFPFAHFCWQLHSEQSIVGVIHSNSNAQTRRARPRLLIDWLLRQSMTSRTANDLVLFDFLFAVVVLFYFSAIVRAVDSESRTAESWA